MSPFFKYFILLQLSVQLVSVVSYTVVLKQVKTLRPSVKVYRYELRHPKLLPDISAQYVHHKPLLGQRIYPVALKPGKEGNWKPRGPYKKEQGRYYKGGEKPVSRDPRLLGLGLSQHLVPPVSNQIEDVVNPEEKEEEEEVRPLVALPAQLGKSFSSFGQEKGRVHNSAGEWATPVPQADSENDTKSEFTPSQLYLQIRHKNTVIHVPQSEALKDAETLEELINAPRLKELARTTHVQETYSEEGYEDAGYDHAGHIRQAQHGEVYDAKDEGRFKIKDPPVILDYDSDLEESKRIPSKNSTVLLKDATATENLSNKLEPRITRSRAEISKTSLEYAKTPKNYKGEHIYSSRVKGPSRDPEGSRTPPANFEATFPSYFGEMPPTPDTALSNASFLYYNPTDEKSSRYGNSTKIFPVAESPSAGFSGTDIYTDFKPYISAIDSQASPSAKSLKYSRIYSKKTKQLRLQPYNDQNVYSPPPPPPLQPPPPTNSPAPPHEDLQPPAEDESPDRRIVLPTIGYINSLTTAHFGKGNPQPPEKESETQLTDALNLTQALDYLRSKKNEKSEEAVTKSGTEVDIGTFEPMKLKKSRGPLRSFIKKREVYLVKTRGRRSEKEEYEGNDESDAPHDEKNEEIDEDERRRIEEENLEKEKYEEDLREEISRQEKEIVKETYKEIGVQDDISEVFPELGSPDTEYGLSSHPEETTPTPVDTGKYPFYLSKRLPEHSALRYATDPKQFPKKSGYKMEFYESREGVIQCPDFHPDLGDLPNSNSSEYSGEQAGEGQRIAGLGDKIACLRMKYFDPEPFDNPIFKEREIDYVGKRKYRKRPQTKTKPKLHEFKQTKQPKPAVDFPIRNHVTAQESSNSPKNLPRAVQKPPKPESPRVIPVTEDLDDIPPQPVAAYSNPPLWWRRVNPTNHLPQGHSSRYSRPPRQPTIRHHSSPSSKHLVIPHDCLKNISNLAVLDGTKNLTIECDDAMLFQEIVRNVARLRIIPKRASEGKEKMRRRSSIPFEESDWVPIVGYALPKDGRRPLSRRTDRVTKLNNETNEDTTTSSNHYIIDELKEEENVRKGEVKDEMKPLEESEAEEGETTTVAPATEEKSSSRRRRETRQVRKTFVKAIEGGDVDEGVGTVDTKKLSEPRRPLARLSGRDFLVRYHRNKGRATTEKTEDFWKVANKQKPQRKSAETEKSVRAAESATKRFETESDNDSQPSNSTVEKGGKYKLKQTGSGSNSHLNQISERVTKSPEVRDLEIWKITAQPLNLSQIVTKVSREMSQSTDKPRIVRKHKETTRKTENVGVGTFPAAKPEVKQQITNNQNSNPPPKESKQLTKSTDNIDGPVLYYVVNLRSGRGKWITRYEKRRGGGGVGKYRKSQKPKEIPEVSTDKGRRNHNEYEFPS